MTLQDSSLDRKDSLDLGTSDLGHIGLGRTLQDSSLDRKDSLDLGTSDLRHIGLGRTLQDSSYIGLCRGS